MTHSKDEEFGRKSLAKAQKMFAASERNRGLSSTNTQPSMDADGLTPEARKILVDCGLIKQEPTGKVKEILIDAGILSQEDSAEVKAFLRSIGKA